MFGRRRKRDETEPVTPEVDGTEDVEEDAQGPFDSSDAPDDDVKRLDLGSLRVPMLPGLKISMPADDRGRLKQEVVISNEDSVLRLAVCAAPRSEGIWDEIRTELTQSVAKQGGKAEETEGPYGTELVAQQPAGQKGTVALRYIGIDGPRWFVRALFHGARAGQSADDTILDDCLKGLIVERGSEAMPVREGLPLELPADMLEEHKKRLAQQQAVAAVGAKQPQPVNGSKPQRRAKPSPKPRNG